MRAAVALPITVKHRLGLVGADDEESLLAFVDTVASAGCDRFVVHARAAVLGGLSPRANRCVPPLRPAEVHALKRARPWLSIEINGGIANTEGALVHLGSDDAVDGVMVGRAAVDDPLAFVDVDGRIFGERRAAPSRIEIGEALGRQASEHVSIGGRAHAIVRHALGLWRDVSGGRRIRGELARADVDLATLRRAVAHLPALVEAAQSAM
jgi:tRNA-dihydrouridine synthase A